MSARRSTLQREWLADPADRLKHNEVLDRQQVAGRLPDSKVPEAWLH